ncbi:MAG: D-alanine--D-alanine ligase, partial [Clostridia bacterium]|nr:D-alanine--D-alanine ligase [Clostridia bacterium]
PNVIPGSLAFYLWEPTGLKFDKLLDKMVEDAFKASADKNRSVFSYQSVILDKMNGAKGKLHK